MADAAYVSGVAMGGMPGTSTSTTSNGNGGNGLVIIMPVTALSSTYTAPYTADLLSYTVPSATTYLLVKMWGAGGGGGTGNPLTVASPMSYGGGAGGYTQCYLSVTPGQQFNIIVGSAGSSSALGRMSAGGAIGGGGNGLPQDGTPNWSAGGGGGRSAIQAFGTNIDLVTAGAGGGGGAAAGGSIVPPNVGGGAGGGLFGLSTNRTNGGTQTSGGVGLANVYGSGGSGSQYQGSFFYTLLC